MAGKFIWVSTQWQPVNVDGTCRNWDDQYRNRLDQPRMSNHVAALSQIAEGLNHVLAQGVRVVAGQCQPVTSPTIGENAQNDTYRWIFHDDNLGVPRFRRFNLLLLLREDSFAGGNQYIQRISDPTAGPPATVDVNIKGKEFPGRAVTSLDTDVVIETLPKFIRNAPQGLDFEEGIATFYGGRIVDFVVEEVEQSTIEIGTAGSNPYLQVPVGSVGQPVVGDSILEEMKTRFAAFRRTNLPTAGYLCFKGASNAYETTSITKNTAGTQGTRIDGTTFVNVLKPASSVGNTAGSKSGAVPGITMHAEHLGVGPAGKIEGRKLRCEVRVLAKAVDGGGSPGTATVRLIGPLTFGSNSVDLAITLGAVGAEPAWYGGVTDRVFLDTAQANTDTSTGRAKVDVFGRTAQATDDLYVYGVRLLATYGNL
jgi:hypothetical protein